MSDDPKETPEKGWEDEGQPLINTDPMRPPQNKKERRIVAPDPLKVRDAERKRQQDDAGEAE
jgi:hypothetical protein